MKAARFFIFAILTLCAHGLAVAQGEQSVDKLVKEFETTKEFWRQFEVAKKLVARGDNGALPALKSPSLKRRRQPLRPWKQNVNNPPAIQ